MKKLLLFSGTLFLAFGCIWFLQGIGILPGSFMTGQQQWAIIGGVCILAGIALLLTGILRKAKPD